MTARKPYLVGIAGGSCSGKSHFCAELAASLAQSGVTAATIALDNFYLDRSHLPKNERWQLNFDHPDALDWPLIRQFLQDVSRGGDEPLSTPRYDFAANARTAAAVAVAKAQVYLIEGLYALSPLTELPYALTLFIDCYESLTLYRRLVRDEASRGLPPEQTMSQFYANVLPMYRQKVEPTRAAAHFTIDGAKTKPAVLRHLTALIACQVPAGSPS